MMGTIVKDMPPLPPKEQKTGDGILRLPPPESPEAAAAAAASAPSASSEPHSNINNSMAVATLSNPWEFNALQDRCWNRQSCPSGDFNPLNRRHHCRLCGKIFCGRCSDQRALIPPSSIVLSPEGGKNASSSSSRSPHGEYGSGRPPQTFSFSPDPDPDRMLSYYMEHADDDGNNQQQQQHPKQQHLLYGKGLEERFQLAREPLRVCGPCWEQLQPLQEELRSSNSNAMRFNHIDPTDPRRFLNSPLAFTLGHEVRKAAYTLNNLLPTPKRMNGGSSSSVIFLDTENFLTGEARELQQCQQDCQSLSPNLANLDGLRIPAKLLEDAKGIATLTVIKGGFGLAGVEFGTGLVVARLGDNQWSAPCAIGTAGVSWGALIGAQVSDHVFLLMTDDAVEMMFNSNGNIQLGADIGVAIGPLGRALEADLGAAPGKIAPIYTYSLSKGLYAGVSLDGKVIVTRDRVNERFYGRHVSGMELLSGLIPTPPAARPLYDALQRCHVYATGEIPNRRNTNRMMTELDAQQLQPPQQSYYDEWNGTTDLPVESYGINNNNNSYLPANEAGMQTFPKSSEMEYGELPEPIPIFPPAAYHHHNDHHSYAGMSDITSDPGY